MILGRVIGSLWATAQHPSFDSVRLVLVVPEDALTGEMGGLTVLAVDTVGSGPGDMVLVVYEGSSSRQVLADPRTPAEAVVVGIVDRLDIQSPGAPVPVSTSGAQDEAPCATKAVSRRARRASRPSG
jgi:microcompartment protein CcmK/EutM